MVYTVIPPKHISNYSVVSCKWNVSSPTDLKMALDNDSAMMIAQKKKTFYGSVLCPCENSLSGCDVLSDLEQARERGMMGRHGAGRTRRKRGSGRKCGSYQHSPRQENRAMMKAKSREEGKDWQAQTDREWRLKWQRDKQAGVQREWGGEKWTAAMKQETKKRQRERQTDR